MPEDLRLSVSKTKTFIDCKAKYKYNYILKLPKKDRDYHIFGKFCHAALEWFHQQYIDGCLLPYNSVMNEAFKVALAEFKTLMTPEMKKECWDIINQYLKLLSKNKKDGQLLNVISVEKKFDFNISDNLVLNGAIDRIQQDDDGVLHVADYKTTKNKKYLTNNWFQLQTYGLVLLKENPDLKKIRGSYILLRHDFEYITKEFFADELLAIEQKYLDYANQILNEKNFDPTPSNLCGWCDFLEFCPQGKEKVNYNQSYKVYGEISW